VTSPADASYRHTFDVDDESRIPGITIKTSPGYATIRLREVGTPVATCSARDAGT